LTSAACRSGTDRVAEVARKVRADVYLNIQGDEPLMTTRTVRAVLALHGGRGVEMGTAATRLDPADWKDPDVVKVLVDGAGDALYFSRAPLPFVRDGLRAERAALARASRGTRPAVLKHLGIYSYRAGLLKRFVGWPEGALEAAERLEQLRAVQRGVRIRVGFTPDDSVGVDRPRDARRAARLLRERGRA
jgi:3-deoxy-D-manno-octulosonate cytidylyltransferase